MLADYAQLGDRRLIFGFKKFAIDSGGGEARLQILRIVVLTYDADKCSRRS